MQTYFSDGFRISGRVKSVVFDKDKNIKSVQFAPNTVTLGGDAHVANKMSGKTEADMIVMAVGTGTNANATNSTRLATEVKRVDFTSKTQGTGANDNDVIYVASFTGITGTVTEAGIRNATVATAATMFVYNKSLLQKLAAADTLQITWTVSFGES